MAAKESTDFESFAKEVKRRALIRAYDILSPTAYSDYDDPKDSDYSEQVRAILTASKEVSSLIRTANKGRREAILSCPFDIVSTAWWLIIVKINPHYNDFEIDPESQGGAMLTAFAHAGLILELAELLNSRTSDASESFEPFCEMNTLDLALRHFPKHKAKG